MENPKSASTGWEQVREVARLRHLSLSTEQSYIQWIRRFWLFNQKQKLRTLGAEHIRAFLSNLAVEKHVSASTQNQAFLQFSFSIETFSRLRFQTSVMSKEQNKYRSFPSF